MKTCIGGLRRGAWSMNVEDTYFMRVGGVVNSSVRWQVVRGIKHPARMYGMALNCSRTFAPTFQLYNTLRKRLLK